MKAKYRNKSELLGNFIEDSGDLILIDCDMDVYDQDTNELIACFRKNAIDLDVLMDKKIFNMLKNNAGKTYSRALAAGKNQLQEFVGKMRRLTKGEVQLLRDLCSKHPDKVDFTYDTEEKNKWSNHLAYHEKMVEDGVTWEKIFEKFFSLEIPEEEWKQEAKKYKKKYVSSSTKSAACNSGVIGSLGRSSRFPYCRMNSYARDHEETLKSFYPFLERVSELYKECAPVQYEAQKKFVEKVPSEYVLGDSVYTTVTTNWNFRTAAHTDSGDYSDSFAALVCMSDTGFEGAYLCLPEYGIKFNFQPRDFFVGNTGKYIHGNTPKTSENDNRLSLVFYVREDLGSCESCKEESLRESFVKHRRANRNTHPESTGSRWQGVSKNMWDSQEWKEYKCNTSLE